jgi:hypothetical protein
MDSNIFSKVIEKKEETIAKLYNENVILKNKINILLKKIELLKIINNIKK